MTKRKTPIKQAPQAPIEAVENFEAKTNTSVTKRPKKANSTTTGASKRTRSKKVVEKVEINLPAPASKVVEINPIVRVVDPMVLAAKEEPKGEVEPPPSLYDRFVGWLFKVTLPFRGH